MKERYKTKSAVFLMVTDGERVLLQKRKNTGFLDEYYDMTVSGHIGAGESATQAMLREGEEIGIREDDKIEELRWFSVENLPDRMPEHDRVAVANYFSGISFCELGWTTEKERGGER